MMMMLTLSGAGDMVGKHSQNLRKLVRRVCCRDEPAGAEVGACEAGGGEGDGSEGGGSEGGGGNGRDSKVEVKQTHAAMPSSRACFGPFGTNANGADLELTKTTPAELRSAPQQPATVRQPGARQSASRLGGARWRPAQGVWKGCAMRVRVEASTNS